MEVFFGLLFLGYIIFVFFFLFALVDILKSKFQGREKIIWLIVVIAAPFIGTIAYFLIGRKYKLKKENLPTETER